MGTKSTHNGECQICGRRQKLPKGRLSLHGYTKRWGFFSGTCPGSKVLPYEQSCDAIKAIIPNVLGQIAAAVAFAAEIRGDRTHVWVHEYVYGSTYCPGGYEWRKLTREEIVVDTFESGGVTIASGFKFVATPARGAAKDAAPREASKSFRSPMPRMANEVTARLDLMNDERAKVVDSHAADLRRYLAWCEERIASWKLAELKENES